MHSDNNILVVVDAIDGAGKTTVLKAMAQHLANQGLRTFDVPAYAKEHHVLPEFDYPEVQAADVLLSAEPTYAWIGAAVREEFIKPHTNRTYDGMIVANVFALDRQILFSRLILPFLSARQNRWIIQDRGVITSLAYQPLQDESVKLPWLLQLEGNRLELSRAPDLLIILDLPALQAQERVANRGERQDIFEETDFQTRLEARYHDEAVLAPFREQGTKVVYLDATQPAELVAKQACEELEKMKKREIAGAGP